jgi:hypothetical protein
MSPSCDRNDLVGFSTCDERKNKLLGRLHLGQSALQHTPQNLQAVQFLAAHCQDFHLVHVGLQGQQGARNPTFLNWRNPTFLNGAYTLI